MSRDGFIAGPAAEGKNGLPISGHIARQCPQEGARSTRLVIHLAPLLLGDGVRLFNCPGLRDSLRISGSAWSNSSHGAGGFPEIPLRWNKSRA
jgi:hypothetical protein